MIVKLENYKLGQRIVSLALTNEAVDNLRHDGMAFAFLKNKQLYFYPGDDEIELSENSSEKLMQCDNYDVFHIDDRGNAYKCYDNESDDNVIMLTAHCNSNCLMCPATDYLRKVENTLTIDEYLEIIRYIPSDARHITITGGEPFLVGPRIFEVFAALKEKFRNTSFLLLTNGRALSYEPYIERYNLTIPNNTIAGIPLHGFDAETHDAITRSPGGFVQTIKGIKNLLRYNHAVELRMVVSRLNRQYITKIAELIVSEFPTVKRVEIMGLEMLGNAAKNEKDVWIPYREAFLSSQKAIDILAMKGINVGLYNFPLCAVDQEYHYIAAKSITDYKVRYAEKCELCQIKDACGGIFAGTIRLAASDVKPVTDR